MHLSRVLRDSQVKAAETMGATSLLLPLKVLLSKVYYE
jgi:indole-3-glycerol phosphate synthase